MQRPFTTFAVTRFVDKNAVRESLRSCAERLKAQTGMRMSVYLFGSFAAGRPTPRSDADIAVILGDHGDRASIQKVQELADAIFLEAPVPAEVFVFTKAELREGHRTGRGVAGAVASHGLLLA